ncbi:unnamed protein product [Rotaria sordida]|uniref:Uncharacterized protein n=1 Tax=Rotaria sordida TaxID=392033 RepID=A0A814B745_9BILA|nr:unnamed protein product [Rotaria sordida]CAF1140066.1 unnamed protein product [Rotaria sordida]CAF3695074.1 unnamed protein product [Rotaria sordida]CAF3748565.1 unnamed protein product [Rotaria sordida]
MNNLIIFHFLLILLTIVNCGNFSTTKKPNTNLQKSKFKYRLNLIIGILLLILIILILILFYIFYIRQRIKNNNNNNNKNKNKKVKRQNDQYDIPIVSYNINELDTIQTVGTPSEFTDHYTETEVKTII